MEGLSTSLPDQNISEKGPQGLWWRECNWTCTRVFGKRGSHQCRLYQQCTTTSQADSSENIWWRRGWYVCCSGFGHWLWRVSGVVNTGSTWEREWCNTMLLIQTFIRPRKRKVRNELGEWYVIWSTGMLHSTRVSQTCCATLTTGSIQKSLKDVLLNMGNQKVKLAKSQHSTEPPLIASYLLL